jgi:hypothetical protein
MTLTRCYNEEPLRLTNVYPENGIMRNVALMSIGEAAGHNCRVDLACLQRLFQLSQGKSIKAFLNHSYNPAPTEVVGVFSGIYIDAEKGILRAQQFKALDAFKNHNRQAYDTLFELAMTAPESFGVSVSIYQELEEAVDGGSAFIRPTSIESADFVSAPAANKALFCKETPLDVSIKQIHNEITLALPVVEKSPHANAMNVIQSIHSAFGKNPDHVARAIQYAVENPEAKPEDVVGEVKAKLDAEDQAALMAENIALKAKVAELEGKLGIAEPEAAKVEELSKKVQAQEAQIVELSKTQRRFGIRPLKTESANVPDSRPTCTQSEFAAKTVSEKMEFSRKGGRISE